MDERTHQHRKRRVPVPSASPLPPLPPLPVVTGPLKPSKNWLNRVARIIDRDGPLCCWCGFKVIIGGDTTDRATIEHVIPRSRGGKNDLCNLKLACEWCNAHRGNADEIPERFRLERESQLRNRAKVRAKYEQETKKSKPRFEQPPSKIHKPGLSPQAVAHLAKRRGKLEAEWQGWMQQKKLTNKKQLSFEFFAEIDFDSVLVCFDG
jgi:5-methylcytosine-specific restriction endonuclease McrA